MSIQLQIETLNHCNAACVFCPYPTMKRAKGVMSDDLFRKIVMEAVTRDHITQITLTGLGEPLLDPHIADRIAMIRRLKPGLFVDLYTNGTYLTHDMSDKLARAGVTVVNVSLNAVTPEKRKAIMRLDDFDKVVEQIEYAVSLKKFRVVVKGIVSKDLMENGESDAFIKRWRGPIDLGGHAFLHLEGNWAGATYPMRVKPTSACSRALSQIMVMWDGRVSLCCFDGEGEVVFGDLNHQTIKEVFDGPAALAYREAHNEGRRGEMKLCATCTAI